MSETTTEQIIKKREQYKSYYHKDERMKLIKSIRYYEKLVNEPVSETKGVKEEDFKKRLISLKKKRLQQLQEQLKEV